MRSEELKVEMLRISLKKEVIAKPSNFAWSAALPGFCNYL